jgi:hypothetical protein
LAAREDSTLAPQNREDLARSRKVGFSHRDLCGDWCHIFCRGGQEVDHGGCSFGPRYLFDLQAIEALRRNAEKESIHELKGCLETLDAIIRKESSRLWLTLHVPIDGGQRLEQILDYVGDTDGSRKAGRRFVAQSGIVGRALREKEPFRFSRSSDDHEQYILELVRDHSYTETDARKTNPSMKSGYAAPLFEGDDVRCVLFLASDDPNMFDDSTALQINRACVGIARFIKDRYSS